MVPSSLSEVLHYNRGSMTPEIPERLLLGPGPSNVPESVRQAMARPLIGHLDPVFLSILDEVQDMLQLVFRTKSALTLPISATGSAGMEACLVNLLEPGDTALVGVQGIFGERMVSIVERAGARAVRVEAEMGEIIEPSRFIEAIHAQRPDLVAWVHAETSTGVAQPVREVAHAAREAGALVVLDCVTSLSGMDVRFDDWAIDAAYSGTQKCLSCPPGLSPAAFGPRALQRLERRRGPVQSWYLDLSLIGRYFGAERVYHHTAPVSMIYALHEALRGVLEEGLEARTRRHTQAHELLVQRLEALGFRMLVDPAHRLPMLNAVIPPGNNEAELRGRLLREKGIEVGAGLGKLAGRVWRIGLMGENARADVVERLVDALRALL
jgi:alanine-glyoxylate transaminase/serine-glyoxylate transaminase/serine-pyruvate transaminase